jgi:hypothetical protein
LGHLYAKANKLVLAVHEHKGKAIGENAYAQHARFLD